MITMTNRAAGRLLVSRAVRLLGLFALLLATASPHAQTTTTYSHTYFGNLPDEGNPGWHSELQGIDHDDSHWYFAQNSLANFTPEAFGADGIPGKCGLLTSNGIWRCPNPRLWRTPASISLGQSVSCGNPATGSDEPICTSLFAAAPDVWRLGYDHFGDIGYYAADATHHYVCVPIEGKLRGGPSLPGAFAFFNADDLSFVAWTPADGVHETAAWCTIDPSGHLYSSFKNADGETDTVLKYRVDWAALAGDAPAARVTQVGAVTLVDEVGDPLTLREYLQGGTFASPTLLYLSNGQGDYDPCVECGIHAFELSSTTPGMACGPTDGDCIARRVSHSTNGSGAFNFEFHPGWSRYEEPEGLTWWDLTAPGAPVVPGVTSANRRVDQTQLHAVLLDNDYPDGDDVYVKHYRVDVATAPITGLSVDPSVVDFGSTDVGTSKAATVRVSNLGTAELTVRALDLVGGGGVFEFTSPVVPPVILAPSADTDVGLRFTPTAGGLATASLAIASNDAARPAVTVPLSGQGVSLVDQARRLLEILDEGIAQSLLVAVGPAGSAANRGAAFRQMLERALDAIVQGDLTTACNQLQSAYLLVDGVTRPADFIAGPEAAAFAAQIQALRAHLGCP